jgi:hypothetical protein
VDFDYMIFEDGTLLAVVAEEVLIQNYPIDHNESL